INETRGRIRLKRSDRTRGNFAPFFIASAARSIRQMKFSIWITSFPSPELSLSRTAQPCDRSRQKSRSGNIWSKPTAHIWRLRRFAESAVNRRMRESWRRRSPSHEAFHWKKLLKRRPKPRSNFSGLIAHDTTQLACGSCFLPCILLSAGYPASHRDQHARSKASRLGPRHAVGDLSRLDFEVRFGRLLGKQLHSPGRVGGRKETR